MLSIPPRRLVLSAWSLLAATLVALAPASGARGAEPSEGGGGLTLLPRDELSQAERAEIQARIEGNIARLAAAGRLPAPTAAGVQMSWPLRARLGPSDFGYHGISAFVDEDPAFPNLLLDYNCGGRTYDTASGYNHKGTDFFTWPFAWNRVDSGAIEVVAGADGVLVGKDDGNPDRSCGGGGAWNAAYVGHADGSVAWYGHMKNGSVTAKNVGDTVVAGDYLGIVASSGNSSGPHLHLELHDSAGAVIDPWQGGCNRTSPDSWWAAQRPYYDSAVNKLMTGFAAVVRGACPTPDVSNEAVVFHPGDTIWFNRYYRDQLGGQPSQSTIYRPDRSVFANWSSASSEPHWAASWWWNSFGFGSSEPVGQWRFEVLFNGLVYNHDFWLVGPGPWLLRDARLSSIAPLSMPLSGIFVGTGATTLDLAGPDQVARPGDGDDDNAYLPGFAAGGEDPDPTVLGDPSRPLVFYQLDPVASPLRLAKTAGGTVALFY